MNIQISVLPKTYLGRWSTWLAATWILFFVLSQVAADFVKVQGLGGKSIDIAVLIPTVGISLGSFITGLISMIKTKEWAILVLMAAIVNLIVLFASTIQWLGWAKGRS